MNRTLSTGVAVVLFAVSGGCSNRDEIATNSFDPFNGPEPIAVLIETDPWLDVRGADTPMVAIYADGQVLYTKRAREQAPVLCAKELSAEALEEIKKKLAAFGDYSKFERYYDLAPNVTDLPETKIYLSLGETEFVTCIYGFMSSGINAGELPTAIGDLHSYLRSLDFADAKPWEPAYLEVMIWGYDYAPDTSIYWPKDWPGLDSPNCIRRGDAYSIFLPGRELAKLQEFLKTRNEKGAVEIGGKKWAVSFRYTFPSEPSWRNAFQRQPAAADG